MCVFRSKISDKHIQFSNCDHYILDTGSFDADKNDIADNVTVIIKRPKCYQYQLGLRISFFLTTVAL